ncbi:MAG: hypothetical protein CL569_16320 [Alphaproteobacteria bacterium]|nr:hypothetical protein [Alphaproteobacteria bacterium]
MDVPDLTSVLKHAMNQLGSDPRIGNASSRLNRSHAGHLDAWNVDRRAPPKPRALHAWRRDSVILKGRK